MFLGNAGDRQILDSNELRGLAGVLGRTASERDGILGQVGQLLAGVDGRGWDVGAVNSLWWRVRGRGQHGSGQLQSLARDLLGRAGLLDEMEGLVLPEGLGLPGPVDGPPIGGITDVPGSWGPPGDELPGITDGPGSWGPPGDGLPGITDGPGSWGLPGETLPGITDGPGGPGILDPVPPALGGPGIYDPLPLPRDNGIVTSSDGNGSEGDTGGGGKPEPDPVPEIDGTGKVHGPLPDHVPPTWTPDDLEQLESDLEDSIATRQAEQQRLGEDGPHRRRINEELQLLRQIQKRLSGS